MDNTNRTGAPPPGRPPGPPPASPPPPPRPPSEPKGGTLVLKVSRRMLWVGTAAYPLHNITMVDAFRLRPNWGAALKALLGAVVLYVVIHLLAGGDARIGENGNPTLLFVLITAVLVIVLKNLVASAKPVLAVQVASGALVVVTLPSMEELRQIAARIAHAIDNPAAEFSTVVNTYNTNNFGSATILNGGQGNGVFKL